MNTYNHTHTTTNSGKLVKARVHQPCTQDSCPIVIVSSEWWSIGEVVNHISDNRCHRHFFSVCQTVERLALRTCDVAIYLESKVLENSFHSAGPERANE